MKRERVELCRLERGTQVATGHAITCVKACMLSRRTVEVTWDGRDTIVFSVIVPMTKRVAKVALAERKLA